MDVSPTTAFTTVFAFPRHAERILRPLGKNGATALLRLMTFVLLCTGVQTLRDGMSELLEPWTLTGR